MSETLDQHRAEVLRGDRFEFGRNWARFLRKLSDERIALAERSLRDMLGVTRLDGKSFLDVGSGSGLFSLAAYRLGARVHSFDYDPHSVACTFELRRRFCSSAGDWTIERASVLDRDYLGRLGAFDVVYSWGVLHHTGKMAQALENVKDVVCQGGSLYIAIYNDLGEITDRWERVKRRYNTLPWPASLMYAVGILAAEEWPSLRRGPRQWMRKVRDYERNSRRGMNWLLDQIDWIGGLPYERATIERIADAYCNDGFRLTKLIDWSEGYGCNEFVFRREGLPGTVMEARLPGGRSLARRYGLRVVGPYERTEGGYIGRVANRAASAGSAYLLLRNEELIGPVTVDANGAVVVARPYAEPSPADRFHVVEGEVRTPSEPFVNQRGHLWVWRVQDLAAKADNLRQPANTSPVYLFEDGTQLPWPHAMHADIERRGLGRFSHWGDAVLFSTINNTDPNDRRDRFRIVIATEGHATRPARESEAKTSSANA